MTLAERAEAKRPTLAARARLPHPKGWEPGVKFESGDAMYVTSDVMPTLEGEPNWRQACLDMGVEIPDGYRVRISEMRFDPVAWTRDDPEQKNAVTKPAWRYRFIVEPDTSMPTVDGVEILNAIKRSPRTRLKVTGTGSMVMGISDTQTGKDAGGGTPALLERFDGLISLAEDRIREDRKQVEDLVLVVAGDLLEGCQIFANQSFTLDLDRRAQIRTTTAMLLDAVDRLSPAFPRVRLICVPGNHGEHRIGGKRTNRHDNDDQLIAEAAATAAERDPKLQHVSFNIAYDEPALTMDVQGWVLAATHGSVFGKSPGAPAVKAYNWYKNMAAGRMPAGDADLLVSAHFHHEQVVNWGNLLWTQLPAMDGGSPEFTDYSGTTCPPGMATWIMTKESRMTGYEVLR